MARDVSVACNMWEWRIEALHESDGACGRAAVCGRLHMELRVVDGFGPDAYDTDVLVMARGAQVSVSEGSAPVVHLVCPKRGEDWI
jgi:hypothetical protein